MLVSPAARALLCVASTCSPASRHELVRLGERGERWVQDLGQGVHGAAAGAAYYELFSQLADDNEFCCDSWARKPMLQTCVPGVADSFILEDLRVAVDQDFLEAGRGIPDVDAPGGWKMAPVSKPRGSSFEDAKMRYLDVETAMKLGTVVFNSAGAHIPALGTMCLAALDAFELPNCLNLYVTAKGTQTSAPPHTDKQDVFVLQSCGAKRWRVFAPPAPAKKPAADPLARGKAADSLDFSELGGPLLDTVLSPGAVLYVPAGFPHTTDTVNTASAGAASEDDSVHLTIGVDTHIWGLDYASMLHGAVSRANLADDLDERTLPANDYWQLMNVPRHLAFLSRHATATDMPQSADAPLPSASKPLAGRVAAELVNCARLAEAKRWAEMSDIELAEALDAPAVEEQIERHADRVTAIQRAMYLDAALDVLPPAPPGAPRVSIFRVQQHMATLESAMESHLQWYGPAAVSRAVAAAKGGAVPTSRKARVEKDGNSAGAAVGQVSGFGGGVKAKAAGKKKKKR